AGLPSEVPMRIKMVHLDAGEGACHLVWQGSFPFHHHLALDTAVLAVALDLPDEPALWPERVVDLAPLPYERFDPGAAVEHSLAKTVVISDRRPRKRSDMTETAAIDSMAPSAPLPFAAPPSEPKPRAVPAGAIPGAPWSRSTMGRKAPLRADTTAARAPK